MSIFQITYGSQALRRNTDLHAVLPGDPFEAPPMPYDGEKTKVLILLNGYTGSSIDWLVGSRILELSRQYNLAVIMPAGENSFYLNRPGAGFAYADFVGKELVQFIRDTFRLDVSRENTAIGGLSMGGFGALHTGLAYPENFSSIIALSSALVQHNVAGMQPGAQDEIADYDYYRTVFGPLDQLEESENNPETLIRRMKRDGTPIPDIYMACGTEDFLYQKNVRFRDFLSQEGVPHVYEEGPGIHDWNFWDEYIARAVKWLRRE